MNANPERRRGRPSAKKTKLNRERILAATLRLVDRHGVEALSMRRLARALGVDAMAIYYHIPGRAALLEGLVERVFHEFGMPATPRSSWRATVRAFARSYLTLVRHHPRLALHLVTHFEAAGDALLPAHEALYAALAAAGLPPRRMVAAADALVDYLNGVALMFAPGQRRLGQPAARPASALFARARSAYPTLSKVFRRENRDVNARIDAALRVVLDGIAAGTTRRTA